MKELDFMNAPTSKVKRKKARAKKQTLILVTVKMTAREQRMLAQNAKRYTDGNVSEWIRYSGITFVPSQSKTAGSYRP